METLTITTAEARFLAPTHCDSHCGSTSELTFLDSQITKRKYTLKPVRQFDDTTGPKRRNPKIRSSNPDVYFVFMNGIFQINISYNHS